MEIRATIKFDLDYCNNAPEACENCPFPDCINNRGANSVETKRINDAFGGDRRNKMKYHRKGRRNDKPKI